MGLSMAVGDGFSSRDDVLEMALSDDIGECVASGQIGGSAADGATALRMIVVEGTGLIGPRCCGDSWASATRSPTSIEAEHVPTCRPASSMAWATVKLSGRTSGGILVEPRSLSTP
jgi:hypothetical protein